MKNCFLGQYKKLIDKTKLLKTYDAYDGSPFSEELSNGTVNHLDLSVPQYGLPMYDWILSLEVVEHMPAQYESVYLDNIFRYKIDVIYNRPFVLLTLFQFRIFIYFTIMLVNCILPVISNPKLHITFNKNIFPKTP